MGEGKKTNRTILTKIKDTVDAGPCTIYELSKKLGSNWDTIKNNVLLLKDLGIVDIVDQNVIPVSTCSFERTKNLDTMAGVPISEESKKRVYALASLIIVLEMLFYKKLLLK